MTNHTGIAQAISSRFNFLILITAIFLTACGGGGSGSDNSSRISQNHLISTGNVDSPVGIKSEAPEFEFDANGNVIAIWTEDTGSGFDVWSNRMNSSGNWENPKLVFKQPDSIAFHPQIEIDEAGDAIAIWHVFNGVNFNLWSSTYGPNTGWSSPELIEENDDTVWYDSKLVMDASGNAMALWKKETESGRVDLWANYFIKGFGWGGEELIDTNLWGPLVVETYLQIDSLGNFITLWKKNPGNAQNSSLFARRFSKQNADWNGIEEVSFAGDDRINNDIRLISLGDTNGFLISWIQEYQIDPWNDTAHLYSKYFSQEQGWQETVIVDENVNEFSLESSAFLQHEKIDDNNVLIYFDKFNGEHIEIWSNSFNTETSWGEPHMIEFFDEAHYSNPEHYTKSDIVAKGKFVVGAQFWSDQQFDGISGRRIWVNQFSQTYGWSTPRVLSENVLKIGVQQFNVDQAMAFWTSRATANPDNPFDYSRNYSINISNYSEGIGWENSIVISNDQFSNEEFGFVKATGYKDKFLITWRRYDSYTLYANSYSTDGGWTGVQTISNAAPYESKDISVSFNLFGRALMLWEDGSKMWASYFNQ